MAYWNRPQLRKVVGFRLPITPTRRPIGVDKPHIKIKIGAYETSQRPHHLSVRRRYD